MIAKFNKSFGYGEHTFLMVGLYENAGRRILHKLHIKEEPNVHCEVYEAVDIMPTSKFGRFLYDVFFHNVFTFEVWKVDPTKSYYDLSRTIPLDHGRVLGILL